MKGRMRPHRRDKTPRVPDRGSLDEDVLKEMHDNNSSNQQIFITKKVSMSKV